MALLSYSIKPHAFMISAEITRLLNNIQNPERMAFIGGRMGFPYACAFVAPALS